MAKSIRDWLFDLPEWGKSLLRGWIVRVLIGTFVGSSALGFLSTCATYKFAYAHGCRVPVEGVPYINLSVALMVFFLIGLGAIGAIACFVILKGLSYAFQVTIFQSLALLKLSDASFFKDVGGVISYYSSLGIRFHKGIPVVTRVGDQQEEEPTTIEKLALSLSLAGFMYVTLAANLIISPTQSSNPFLILVLFTTVMAVYVSVCVYDWMVWVWTAIFGVLVACVTITSLFDNDTFVGFLRATKLGGGIEVKVEQPSGKEGELIEHSNFLILSTNQCHMLYDDSNKIINEIPITKSTLIEYKAAPAALLPEYNFQWPDVRWPPWTE